MVAWIWTMELYCVLGLGLGHHVYFIVAASAVAANAQTRIHFP